MKHGRIYGPEPFRWAVRVTTSPPETCDHALVNLPSNAHVVEVVLPYLSQPAGVIKIKHLAALNRGGLAGFNAERPGDVVQADVAFRPRPPTMHGVEDAPHVVLAEIYQRRNTDV